MRWLTGLILPLVWGCSDVTVHGYEDLTVPLDGRSELHVSTYPSWFPDRTEQVPFLYEKLRTPDEVYLQVFVRDAERGFGPNRHIDAITIHSFRVEQPGMAPVELVSGFGHYFWMQNDPEDAPGQPPPVRWVEESWLTVSVEMTIDGVEHAATGRMPSYRKRYFRPLLMKAFR